MGELISNGSEHDAFGGLQRMRIGILVNEVDTEQGSYTSTRLALAASRRGHEVWEISVGDLAYDPDGKVHAWGRSTNGRCFKTCEGYLKELRSDRAHHSRLTLDDFDVVLLRNDPAEDATNRPWATQAGIHFGRVAARHGVLVLNDPDGLGRAANKMYLETFPEQVRPRTLITRNRNDIRAFAREYGTIVLKPLQGSGGQSVFLVRPDDVPNINQMIDAVSRYGFVIAQEYLPKAQDGDTRLFVMNGEPLRWRGRYAAMRRVRTDGDLRSNRHVGGGVEPAVVDRKMLDLVEIIRPKLVRDGMFLVGLDIVEDRLMEINVFSPGGLGQAQRLTGVNFADVVVRAIERKVAFKRLYFGDIDNAARASL